MKIVENPSLFMHQCTFTMPRPRYTAVQPSPFVCGLIPDQFISLQAFNVLKAALSGYMGLSKIANCFTRNNIDQGNGVQIIFLKKVKNLKW